MQSFKKIAQMRELKMLKKKIIINNNNTKSVTVISDPSEEQMQLVHTLISAEEANSGKRMIAPWQYLC